MRPQTWHAMDSSCRSRHVALNSSQLSLNGGHDALRFPETQRNPANVRTVQAQLLRDTGKQAGLHCCPENISVERGIFIGHKIEPQRGLVHDCCNNECVDVSSAKSSLGGSEPALPEWAVHISNFMKSLRLSQVGFAAKLNVTQQAVNNWLKGRREPAAEMYYRMTRLDPVAPEAAPLIARARALTKGQFPPPEKYPGVNQEEAVPIGAIMIPLIKPISALGDKLKEEDIEQQMPFPSFFCAKTVGDVICFRALDDCMSPLFESGCIVAVDRGLTDPALLRNEMVALFSPDGRLTVRWLRRFGMDAYLAPQNVTRDNHMVLFESGGKVIDGWRLVGKVLWWVGTAV